jgi:polyketide biosynthesis acyl carrier protein
MTVLVRDVVHEILPGVPRAQVTGDKHLKDLGADSVDRVEIILSLIDRLGIDEPMSSFSDLPDLDTLVDFLVKTGSS